MPIQFLYKRKNIVHIHAHHFSAGQGYSSSRFFIEHFIFLQLFYELFYRIFLSRDFPDVSQAILCTFSTTIAFIVISNRFTVLYPNRSIRAGLHAGSASGTFLPIRQNLFLKILCFRIVAPCTFKWATFKKNTGSNSISVMYGILLYIRN